MVREQMLLYTLDKGHHLKVSLSPMLEGAEVNGVVLKWEDIRTEKFIKLRNPTNSDYLVKTEMTGICVSNVIEDKGFKFKSVSTTLFDEVSKNADLDLQMFMAQMITI